MSALEQQRVTRLLAMPAAGNGWRDSGRRCQPLELTLATRLAPGQTTDAEGWSSVDASAALARRCAEAGAVVAAASQGRADRLARRALRLAAAAAARIGARRLARRLGSLPTRYRLSLRGLHSDC